MLLQKKCLNLLNKFFSLEGALEQKLQVGRGAGQRSGEQHQDRERPTQSHPRLPQSGRPLLGGSVRQPRPQPPQGVVPKRAGNQSRSTGRVEHPMFL